MTERYEHPSDPSTSETPASAATTESSLGASTGMSRRTLLKGAVAAAGIAGFPYVHAQEKITLRYLGTAVNQRCTPKGFSMCANSMWNRRGCACQG